VPPAPQPPAPQPVVMPPPPAPSPEPVIKPEPLKLKPIPDKVQPHKIEPNLKPVVHNAPRNVPKNTSSQTSQQARALRNAIRSLKNNLSSSTTVDMPGNSSVAYANYASAVKSIYDQAWAQVPLDSVASEDENVKARVVIASDGTVVSARIIDSSGDAALDTSVRKTLERVTFIAPFPEGTTDKQRTYTINFNPQLRKMLE